MVSLSHGSETKTKGHIWSEGLGVKDLVHEANDSFWSFWRNVEQIQIQKKQGWLFLIFFFYWDCSPNKKTNGPGSWRGTWTWTWIFMCPHLPRVKRSRQSLRISSGLDFFQSRDGLRKVKRARAPRLLRKHEDT